MPSCTVSRRGDLGDAAEWFDWEAIAALKAEAERKLGELERAGV